MTPITVAYLVALRVCWTRTELEDASKSWPDPCTWAWWLGERLGLMPRNEAYLRVQVAFAHIVRQKLIVPIFRPGVALAYVRKCSDAQFTRVCLALGGWLDGPTDDTAAELADALSDQPPRIIEAAPPMAAPPPPEDDPDTETAHTGG